VRDLLGPAAGPEEELAERHVRDRYLVGTRAPKYQRIDPEEQDSFEVEDGSDEDGLTDPSAPPPDSLFPSSLGLSCAVSGEITRIRVTARWGRYACRPAAQIPEGAERPPLIWKRIPMEATVDVDLTPGTILPNSIHIEQPQVLLRGVVRRLDDRWLLSIFLVSHQQEPDERRDDPLPKMRRPHACPRGRLRPRRHRPHLARRPRSAWASSSRPAPARGGRNHPGAPRAADGGATARAGGVPASILRERQRLEQRPKARATSRGRRCAARTTCGEVRGLVELTFPSSA
jgi:hypothetical protein